MNQMPFPSNASNQNWQSHATASNERVEETPWSKINAGERMPLMFQVQFANGRSIYYPYSDLREIRTLHAGHVELFVFGIEKWEIKILGRHLEELVTLIGMGRIRCFEETGHRSFDLEESVPAIDRISVNVSTIVEPSGS